MLSPEDSALEAPQSLFSPQSAGPTVQRLVLGGHLRRLREDAGITTERAAVVIRGSHSKISRMEHGRVGFKERDIADLLTLYGVSEGDEREALLKLARGSNLPGWWQSYSDILPHWVEPYFGLEAAASFIREYELQFVPGLLQTEAYARAVIRLGTSVAEDEIVRRAQARVSRQEILRRDVPAEDLGGHGRERAAPGDRRPRGHEGAVAAPARHVRSPGRDACRSCRSRRARTGRWAARSRSSGTPSLTCATSSSSSSSPAPSTWTSRPRSTATSR